MISENNKKDNTIKDILNKRKGKKQLSETFYNVVNRTKESIGMSKNTAYRIKDCGTFLEFITDTNLEKYKLVGANFCGNRFCPHCSYNNSRKLAVELSLIIDYLKEKDYKFIFLTLTAPNVPGSKLNQELEEYSSAFKRLFERKEIKKITKGYIRKLEVTYNKERNDFHPHYHVLIAVNKSYFNNSNQYITQAKWLEYWRQSKNDYDINQVDVRKFKENKKDTAIFELSKYISKDNDNVYSDNVFVDFYKALKGKRELSFNGEFRKARKLYKDGKLDHLKEKDTTKYVYKIYSLWKNNNYNIEDLIMLTPEELEKYNIDTVDEMEVE